MKLSDFLTDIGRPVAYYPSLTEITGGVKETVFLCQLIYWHGKQWDPDGWIVKTAAAMTAETGLTPREQKRARETLKRRGLLEEKLAGIPATLHFRLCLDVLNSRWDEIQNQRNVKTSSHQTSKPDSTKCANQIAPNVQTGFDETAKLYTETTAQSTSESTPETTEEEDPVPSELVAGATDPQNDNLQSKDPASGTPLDVPHEDAGGALDCPKEGVPGCSLGTKVPPPCGNGGHAQAPDPGSKGSAASGTNAVPARKRKGEKDPPDPRVNDFRQLFQRRFEERFGVPYTAGDYGAEGRLIKRALKTHGSVEAVAAGLDRYFGDEWQRAHGRGCTILGYLSSLNNYLAPRAPEAEVHDPHPKQTQRLADEFARRFMSARHYGPLEPGSKDHRSFVKVAGALLVFGEACREPFRDMVESALECLEEMDGHMENPTHYPGRMACSTFLKNEFPQHLAECLGLSHDHFEDLDYSAGRVREVLEARRGGRATSRGAPETGRKSSRSAEPEVLLKIPLETGPPYELTQEKLADLQHTFPMVDVMWVAKQFRKTIVKNGPPMSYFEVEQGLDAALVKVRMKTPSPPDEPAATEDGNMEWL